MEPELIQKDLTSFLTEHFSKNSLPGKEVQYEMAALNRPPKNVRTPANATQAGVLALLYPNAGKWHLIYIERQPHHGQDAHRGQISFPGGKLDPGDTDLKDTALREAEEEVNVLRDEVHIVGKLTNLYIPVSNFNVHPYLGISEVRPDFKPDITEVRDIVEIPVSHLLDANTIKKKSVQVPEGFTIKNVPYFDLNGRVLWGATAMMTNELMAILKSSPKVLKYM